jgi:protein subunit release factor A
MPITRELENIEELEAVNFNHEQAKTLAKIIESSHADSHESLKEFIRAENKTIRSELKQEIAGLRSELKQDTKDLEIRMAYAQKDLLLKIFAIITGTSAMLFAALKLFG